MHDRIAIDDQHVGVLRICERRGWNEFLATVKVLVNSMAGAHDVVGTAHVRALIREQQADQAARQCRTRFDDPDSSVGELAHGLARGCKWQ